ncbi:hypothetical protein OHA09_36965 [Streptomyces longwoodensis]|uniref:hypothetical protein n=1 Tax=Streptomyces longwoodensis TaxID=68231 RepID=UPI002DD8C1CA|nr:hypothetical protein [Streptomyces longwoodensis]WRY92867.1 hypothetical protein OG481_32210 [Streptomyces longwoodensis]WUC55593.1 hypothetical protein OHA09_00005 [Streptomyces longwoodensis]WUC62289.1 hypothetical protein OHA09_36965 [Streptomyces longwoodensis]
MYTDHNTTWGPGGEGEAFFSSGDHWAEPWVLNVELIESLRFGPPADQTDLGVAVVLPRLLEQGFESQFTKGPSGRFKNLMQTSTWWIKNHEPDSDETAATDSLYRRLHRDAHLLRPLRPA